MYTKVYTLLS